MAKDYNPFVYRNVEVVRVIDGDTVRLSIDVGFKMRYEDNFRLWGIDTPERGQDGFEEASDRMSELLMEGHEDHGRCLEVEVMKRDKYGRYLAVIRDAETGDDLNQMMIEEGLAKAYHGGKR